MQGPTQQKIQNVVEATAGTTVSIYSLMADLTDIVQAIGVWCGALIAMYGLYEIIKREYGKHKGGKSE